MYEPINNMKFSLASLQAVTNINGKIESYRWLPRFIGVGYIFTLLLKNAVEYYQSINVSEADWEVYKALSDYRGVAKNWVEHALEVIVKESESVVFSVRDDLEYEFWQSLSGRCLDMDIISVHTRVITSQQSR